MKPVSFIYHRPQQLSEALDLVAELDNYKIIAGGQSLMPMMNFRFVMPDHVIDWNHWIIGIPDFCVKFMNSSKR
jgi:carbon-monoxide dehydrogenase medium subunit